MTIWNREFVEKIAILRSEGKSWIEIKDDLKYTGSISTLRGQFSDKGRDFDLPIRAIKEKASAINRMKLINKVSRAVLADSVKKDDLIEQLKSKMKSVKVEYKYRKHNHVKKETSPMICEALLSDLQIGKVTPDFNTEIARKRLKKYGESLIYKIRQHEKANYKFDKIILALLGDIIESSEKAALKNSALSVDTHTNEQIINSVQYIYQYVIAPLQKLKIPIEVVCIPGNHDNRMNGMPMDRPGLLSDTWIIYNMLEMLSDDRICTYKITSGLYDTSEVYGHTIVYEHGYGIPVQEKRMLERLNQRTRQEKKHITYFRMGDKHNISRFNEDTLVVNGAFFGNSPGDKGHDYSSAMGYSALAAQIVFFHVPRSDERLPCYDSFIIQLNHIK